MPHSSSQSQTDIAISKLWSADENVRDEGKDELLRIGPATIEKLTALLAELIHDQRPRFSPGREKEGERALDEYLRSVRTFYKEGVDYNETKPARDRLTALTINARWMTDVIHLLAELKAEPAVPLLLELVNRQWEIQTWGPEIHTPATAALGRIGAAVVPQLIQNLDEATIRAYGFEPVAHGWRMVIDDEDEDENQDDESDPEEEALRQTHIGNIRLRVAVILADIGDPRALPYLEKLLAESNANPESPAFGTAGSLSGTIESSIARINKTGPWSAENNANTAGRVRVVSLPRKSQ